MPPIFKENEIPAAKPDTAGPHASIVPFPGEAAVKQQPVALEVMVTVNGVRTLEGSDKREPFSENTKTVLVFGSGAVIRLSSSVAPGQLLFLTNEKTRREIVCQVVKSKNYRNVSGYVELEFTEPAVGFWGMRFPGDRISSTPPAAPLTSPGSPAAPSSAPVLPRPVIPSVGASLANNASKTLDIKPLAPAGISKDSEPKLPGTRSVAPAVPFSRFASPQEAGTPVSPASAHSEVKEDAVPVKPLAPESAVFDLPRASEAKASILEPPPPPSASPVISLNSLLANFEAKSAPSPAVHAPQAPIASDPETQALKQQTARLQEQLSTLLFTDTAPAKAVQKAPNASVIETPKPVETAEKVLEIAKTEPEPVRLSESAKISHAPVPSSLGVEELKIPAWLEPLARNAAAPVSTQDLIEREKAKRLVEQPAIVEIAQPPDAVNAESLFEAPVPTFGSDLPIDEIETPSERSSRSSGKGVLLGAIAVGLLLLVGGGVWYVRRQSSGASSSALSTAAQTSAVSLPTAPSQTQPLGNAPLQTNPSTQTNLAAKNAPPVRTITVGQADSVQSHAQVEPASVSATPVRSSQPSSSPTNAATVFAASDQPSPTAAQVKKPLLGRVHLAAPKVSKHGNLPDAGETETGLALSEGQLDSNAEVLGTGLPVGTKQPSAPTAPLRVGGDVKQAKLASSVAPVYPMLAKSQHVSGDVRLDALIDANGRVTTMKVVSGPTLLHQAAMDALRQWRYQPATLDGKPVPMHLTVTIQFRLQ